MALIQMEFKSETLKRTVPVNVILPIEKFKGPYPTLYLLHGLTDNCNGWLSYSRIRLWAEDSGLAVVMPSGENSFYMDILVKDGCLGDFGEYVGRELVEVTREMFPLSHKREDTFIGGLSMGGFGALHTALTYPDRFSKVMALSSALIIDELKDMSPGMANPVANYEYYAHTFGDLKTAHERDCSPAVLYRKRKAEGAPLPQIYMACGTEDFLLAPNRRLRDFLQSEGADLRYEEGPGMHDWNFWYPRSLEGVEWLLNRK